MNSIKQLKNRLYFIVAKYFYFFASVRLKKWGARVVVVTGSNGKTSTLNLISSQLKDKARYSFGANTTYGIPFDILNLKRKNFQLYEWIFLFLLAPVRVLAKPFPEKIYVVEADSDRPGEGSFLAKLLRPEVTIWLSCDRTHSQNFDRLVTQEKFSNVDKAIAYEFGKFIQKTEKLCILNQDNPLIVEATKISNKKMKWISTKDLDQYNVSTEQTEFLVGERNFSFPGLLPEKFFYSLMAALEVTKYLGEQIDYSFSDFNLPPGRSSILKGKKNTILIDSSYNANYASVEAILDMYGKLKVMNGWLILGDLIEQGLEEKEEHQKLVSLIKKYKFSKIILVGPRLNKFTFPSLSKENVVSCIFPKDALSHIQENIKGGEVILFKGARFLEGIVEQLLLDKKDANKLCRRETVWQERRKEWNL